MFAWMYFFQKNRDLLKLAGTIA